MLSCESYPNGITVCGDLEDPVKVYFTGTDFGNLDSRFGDKYETDERLAQLMAFAGIGHVAVIAAEHGTSIVDLGGKPLEEAARTHVGDGLIGGDPRIGKLLLPADCNGVALWGWSPRDEKLVSALVHAGWRGTDQDIHTQGVRKMRVNYGVEPRELKVFIGPSIRPESYVYRLLPPELREPEWKPYVWEDPECPGRYHIDVLGRVIDGLLAAGVDPDHLQVSPEDTGAPGSRFFSHACSANNGAPQGRNAFLIVAGR